MSSYSDIGNNNFYEMINNKFGKFKISKKKKTFEQICFPNKFELQVQQKFLAEFINPKTPYKSILIFHKIGAGKTCTAVSIAEKWKKERKIIVTVPASLIGNFKHELRSECAGTNYLTNKERELLLELHPSSDEYKEIIKKSNERIDKYYDIYSYNKFIENAKLGKLKLKNALLIIDEIQNMVSETGTYYDVLYKLIHEAPNDLRIIIMSATPMFDKPVEIALTMNLLRIPVEFPIGKEFEKMFISSKFNKQSKKFTYKAKNLDIFKERIRGYVSYYAGAPLIAFPEALIKYVKCEMSEFQYRSYLTVLKKEEDKNKKFVKMKKYRAFKNGEILELPSNFFIGARIISNIAFPNKNIGIKGFESLKGKILELENVQDYSIKFFKIINKISKSSGKIFIYSSFKSYGGIYSFVKILEGNGYKNYTNFGEGKKRFAIISGDQTKEEKENIKNIFNQKENINGHKLKIIYGSVSTREGYSFYSVQQVHILEPYWNLMRMKQIIGRAVRYCSHKDLPEEKRLVKVYIYVATHPDEEETVDQYIVKLAIQKAKIVNQFETALKEVAIDCELFKEGNSQADSEAVKCDT